MTDGVSPFSGGCLPPCSPPDPPALQPAEQPPTGGPSGDPTPLKRSMLFKVSFWGGPCPAGWQMPPSLPQCPRASSEGPLTRACRGRGARRLKGGVRTVLGTVVGVSPNLRSVLGVSLGQSGHDRREAESQPTEKALQQMAGPAVDSVPGGREEGPLEFLGGRLRGRERAKWGGLRDWLKSKTEGHTALSHGGGWGG